MRSNSRSEWVATTTFVDERAGRLIEEGGVYFKKPDFKAWDAARRLGPAEEMIACPRCGQRFAATGRTPEENRDVHVYGDEDSPSICLVK